MYQQLHGAIDGNSHHACLLVNPPVAVQGLVFLFTEIVDLATLTAARRRGCATVLEVTLGKDGRAHRVPVTIGIRNEHQVQVTSGLAPGDHVITSGGYALSDGLRVSVAQARK